MPFLVWDSPRGRSVRELDRALIVIGRDAGCDIVIEDATVSRRHALVQVGGGVKVTDLRSTAATRINGAKLAPDVPCTLEPGDFLQVGKVVLSFHTAPPPPPASPPPAPPSPPRHAARARRPFPWKPFAIGLAFLAVIAGGALLAFVGRGDPPPPGTPPPEVARQPTPPPAPVAPQTPERAPTPPPEEPARPPEPERAAAGELPPRETAPDLPDLVEVDGKTHLPARVKTLGDDRIEVIGADGRLYAIAAKRVTKIEDRADLKRRLAIQRLRLGPDDVPGRVALAGWCLDRLLRDDARTLVREALSKKPDDAAARAMQARLEEQE